MGADPTWGVGRPIVFEATTTGDAHPSAGSGQGGSHDLGQLIEHAAHLLPSQGPITVFVHHNTLHAFEELSFDAAVEQGALTYGCHPYLAEDYYRCEVARGRTSPDDLAAELIEDLG